MSKRRHICIIAAAATALLAGELLGAVIRRSTPGGQSGRSASSSGVTRTPSLPRSSSAPRTVTRSPAATPQARPPTVTRSPTARTVRPPTVSRSPAPAARSSSAVRDWSYPRSTSSTGARQLPGRATVSPARPNLPARGSGGASTARRGDSGFSGTRDLSRLPRTREPYLSLNQGARGSTTWTRDAQRFTTPRSTTGFRYRLDRHWDANTRRQLAQNARRHVHGYDFFRPGWRGYTRGWAAGAHWTPWQNYWSWHGWRPYHWWRAPSWTVVAGWMPATTWTTFVPYDYGENIIYQNNVVYQNGQQLATADAYAAQAMQLAAVDVPPPPQLQAGATVASDWQPLGVFALVTDENVAPTMFLQLALSRQGYIAGTYFNQLTGETRPVAGSVDARTQRAAWRIGDSTTTVMEAGVYNLTQDQAPILIHFGKERTENYLLVRMEQPAEGAPAAGVDYYPEY